MDEVLVSFGIALTVVGVALFARSKVTGENSMKLLGMEVQVSHPSLFIFFSGIVLILVPRLLPHGSLPPAAIAGDPTADPPVAEAQLGAPVDRGPVVEEAPAPEGEPADEAEADCDSSLPTRLDVENVDQYLATLGRVLENGCAGTTYVVGNDALDLGFTLQLAEHFEDNGRDCRAYTDPEEAGAPREFACQIGGRWEVVEGEPFE